MDLLYLGELAYNFPPQGYWISTESIGAKNFVSDIDRQFLGSQSADTVAELIQGKAMKVPRSSD